MSTEKDLEHSEISERVSPEFLWLLTRKQLEERPGYNDFQSGESVCINSQPVEISRLDNTVGLKFTSI